VSIIKNYGLVSIVIPAYNREKYIHNAIESAINQTYRNIEIIIIDNFSTDKTFDICNYYSSKDLRIKIYKNIKNIGPVKNWIECLNKCTGDFVKIIWSDDWIDFDYIEKTLPYLFNNEDIGFVYTAAYIQSLSQKILAYKLFKNTKIINSSLFEKYSLIDDITPVSPGCALFRKQDIIENLILDIPNSNGLDFSKYGAGNDLLIYLLTLNKYPKVCYVSNTKSYFLAHNESFTISNNLNIYYDWAKFYYINTYNSKYLKLFKTSIMVKMLSNKNYLKLYKSINSGFSIYHLITILLKNLLFKIKHLIRLKFVKNN
jgi:glycosyltransferase involved in cell wall biosynthesis